MDSQKLIADIKTLLQTAGFDQIVSAPAGAGTIVSGQAGTGRALFQWTPQPAARASGARVVTSAPHGDTTGLDIAVAPSMPGLGTLKELPAEAHDALVARSRARAAVKTP